MENLFSFNLDVLSLDLYGWRSLEAALRKRLKARDRRLKSKTLEEQKTPDSRSHLSTKAHPKASIPTHKPSSTQEPTSFRAQHTKLILQQSRNITLSRKTGAQKSHQTNRHLKSHYWTLHCTPERRDPPPPTRTPLQTSLTRKP